MLSRRIALTSAASVVLLAALTACGTSSPPAPTATTPLSSSPSATPSPPRDSSSPAPSPVPVTASCNQLVSADTLYGFNPNYGIVDGFKPKAGTDGASAVAKGGVACRWMNQTSSDTIDLSVASLDTDAIEALKNAAYANSQMVPTYGDEAYFSVKNNVGTAIVFSGAYWLVVSSAEFLEPGDATDIVNSALNALS